MKKLKVTIPALLLFAIVLFAFGNARAQCAFSGNYTVNSTLPTNVFSSGTNFNSLFDLSLALNQCGVSGNFTATVAPGTGPYNEQVRFFAIPGAGPNATVTINGSGETVTYTTTAIDRHIFRLYNQQYFTLKNFKIERDPLAASGFMGVHIFTSGSNINIENIVVDMKGSTSTLVGGIIASGDTASILSGGNFQNVNIINNKTMDGGYGVSVYGLSTSVLSNGINIGNNEIVQASGNGVYLRETNAANVSGNTINIRTGNGIQVAQATNSNALIKGNWISANNPTITTTIRGIYIFGAIAGTGHKVINNVVHNMNTPLAVVYAYAHRGSQTYYYNNTALLDGGSASASTVTAAFQEELSNTNFHLVNNILVVDRLNTGNQAAIILGSTTNISTSFNSNNNVFFVPNGNIGSRGTVNYASLPAWNSATTHDANSFNVNPMFMSAAVPAPTNTVIDNTAMPLVDVSTDIYGNLRSTTPDPGAIEFPMALSDAGVYMIDFTETCGSNDQSILIEVKNFGTTALTNFQVEANITGMVNTNLSTTFNGTLAPNATTLLNLGSINTTAGGALHIKAFTSIAGDFNHNNDTLASSHSLFPAPLVNAGNDVNLCIGGNALLTAGPAGLNFLWSTSETTNIISVSPLVTTQYVVTGFDANNCTASDTVIVNVLPIPALSISGNLLICEGNSTTLVSNAPTATAYAWSTGATTPDISVAPVTSSYFALTVSNGNCSKTDSVLVTVNPAPQITGQNSYDVCAGETVTLSVSGADDYVWGHGPLTNTIVVNPLINSQYSVMGSFAATGCSSGFVIIVNVYQPTAIQMTELENEYCESVGTVNLSATPGGGTFSGPGVSGTVLNLSLAKPITGYDNGFQVYYTFVDANGCTTVDSSTTKIQACTSINEMGGNNETSVFPNPFSNAVFISMEKSKISKVEMLDMKGAAIKIEISESSKNTMVKPIENIEPGVYFIRVLSENIQKTYRLIKH